MTFGLPLGSQGCGLVPSFGFRGLGVRACGVGMKVLPTSGPTLQGLDLATSSQGNLTNTPETLKRLSMATGPH